MDAGVNKKRFLAICIHSCISLEKFLVKERVGGTVKMSGGRKGCLGPGSTGEGGEESFWSGRGKS